MNNQVFSINILPINRSKKKILVQLRDDKEGIKHPNEWCIIGGRSIRGEDMFQALARELKEETGIITKEENAILVYKDKTLTYEGKEIEAFYYVIETITDHVSCGEGQEIRFMSLEEIMGVDNFIPYQRKIIFDCCNKWLG